MRFVLNARMPPADIVASFIESYSRRVRIRQHRQMCKNFKQPTSDVIARTFREILLEHVSRYTARSSGEIRRRMEDDYGPVGYQRLWRHLRRLVKDGAIVRTPDGYLLARKR